MLQEEFQYYIDHQDELVKKYNHQCVVIKDKQVVGVFPTLVDAYNASIKKYKLGTFILQEVSPGDEKYTIQYFNHRVTF
ncbi:MAG: hypothetical protein LBU51_01650 [Bacteroidales bacterium]|jgi:hypothetical protein|nr:hypothetical protein [Bacteroidales bacterium]